MKATQNRNIFVIFPYAQNVAHRIIFITF